MIRFSGVDLLEMSKLLVNKALFLKGHYLPGAMTFQANDGWMDGYFVYRRSTLKGHIASNKMNII